MARLIIFNDYLNASKNKSHLLESLHYISEREGVETNDKNIRYRTPLNQVTSSKAVSENQERLIKQLLNDFPDLNEDLILEEYEKNKNMYTASIFISDAMNQIEEMAFSNEIYMQYISTRPNVEKNEDMSHGLFDITGSADLSSIEDELKNKDGNVWRSIISLRRTDAAQLDFENQKAWREMLINHIPKLAEEMNIPFDHFRWCAAFHNESYHPHIHMMYWSTQEHEGFCSKETIHNFKSALVNDIFSNEIWLHKEFKTEKRNDLEKEFKEKFEINLNEILDTGTKEAMKSLPKEIYDDMLKLSQIINPKGSHYYQYQSPEVKNQTDLIVAKILSSNDMSPIVNEYLKSQTALAAYYMKEDSPRMEKYMNEFCDKLIHPGKGDRKVIHNEIVKVAYDIKSEVFLKQQQLDPLTDKVYNLLNQHIHPEYLRTNQEERFLKAVCRFSMYMDHDPKKALEHMSPFLPSPEKGMELMLKIRSEKEDIMEKDLFNESDWKILERAYFGSNQSKRAYIPPDQTAYCCAKMIQSIINMIANDIRETAKEAHRLMIAKNLDENILKRMHFAERKRKR